MNLYITHLRNDIRQIVRDPIMLILMLVPCILIVLSKLAILLLFPWLLTHTGFDFASYHPYVLSFVLLLSAGMLGIVTGFLMLDERDGSIAELMSVTPLGRSGYLLNRLSFSSFISVIYGILIISVLQISMPGVATALNLCLMMALYSSVFALILYSGADDKVKGLTFAKALNVLSFFGFTDLFHLPWLTGISWLFPSYWITAAIKNPGSLPINLMAAGVHLLWFAWLISRYLKRSEG